MATSQVILTEAISSLGAEADIVKVRAGYARNFLIPYGKALEVTPSTLRRIDHLKAKRAQREAQELVEAEELASKINKLHLSFTLETGIAGKAFGSITAHDLLSSLQKELAELQDKPLPRHAIVLERPIKETGDQTIAVRLHPDVVAKLHIEITAAAEEENMENKKEAKSQKIRSPKASSAQ